MNSTNGRSAGHREFLVATHSALLSVSLDAQWRLIGHAVIAQGYHYGIAVLGEGDARGDRFIAYRGGESVLEQTQPELMVYERNAAGAFEVVATLAPGLVGDVHQLAAANGGLYLADTKYNRVLYHGLDNDRRDVYEFGNVRRDVNHVNSVFPHGRHVIAMLHNLKRRESQLVVLKHDADSGFRLEHTFSLWDRNCHNVYLDGRTLLYNASMVNELVVVDLVRDRVGARLSLNGVLPWPGHVKGLSVIDGYWVIGVSQETSRFERSTSMSALAVFDSTTHEVVATVDLHLPGLARPVGNVNEVRLLSGPDHAEQLPQPLSADVMKLRLAKNDLLNLLRARVSGVLLGPVRRVRRRMRVGKV